MSQQILENGTIQVSVDVGRKVNGKRDRMTKVCQTQEEANAVEEGFERIREINQGKFDKISFVEYVKTFFWPAKKHIRQYAPRLRT